MASTKKATSSKKNTAPVERAVLVTTQHRGVFFGYTTADGAPDTVDLVRARLCVYWPPAQKGFLGLAATGPERGARIGPQTPKITLRYVTSVSELTPEAVTKFEAAPWS